MRSTISWSRALNQLKCTQYVSQSRRKMKVIVSRLKSNARSVSGSGPEFFGWLSYSLKRYIFDVIDICIRELYATMPIKKNHPHFQCLCIRFEAENIFVSFSPSKSNYTQTTPGICQCRSVSIVYLKYCFQELLKYGFQIEWRLGFFIHLFLSLSLSLSSAGVSIVARQWHRRTPFSTIIPYIVQRWTIQ